MVNFTLWLLSTEVPFPAGAKNFHLGHRVQTGSGAHTANYLMGTGSKAAGT